MIEEPNERPPQDAADKKASGGRRPSPCSPSSRRYACDECHDTGYFGDMGPGVRGNNEWTECDCKRRLKTDDEKWRDHFVHPIALEMKINNNFTAHFARMFHIAHPRHDGFFRNRKLLSTSDEAAILERIRETIHP